MNRTVKRWLRYTLALCLAVAGLLAMPDGPDWREMLAGTLLGFGGMAMPDE
ncbi:MAG: hypothetical protein WC211_03800 [Dehalococcoidia bacterium]